MIRAEDVIRKEMIFLREDQSDRNNVLDVLIQGAKNTGLVTDEASYLNAVLKREEEVPTAVGYNVAIPHGKSSSVKEPFIGFLQTSEAFQWSSNSEEMVKLVFLIGVPEENQNNIHLKFISILSKKLLDEEFRDKLEAITDENEAYTLLTSINQEIKK